MGEAKVEEAVVAVFAAIGNLKQHTAKDQIFDALPERAVNSVTAAPGTNVRMMTMRGFVHGKLQDRGKLYYTFSFRKKKRIVLQKTSAGLKLTSMQAARGPNESGWWWW